jgi:hypothetical protein
MTLYTWFYTLPQSLTAAQQKSLEAAFQVFLDSWKTHGKPVQARIEVRHGRFVLIQSDPSDSRPSGCSIDSMRRTVEQILTQHELSWLDNAYVHFKDENGAIRSLHFRELPALAQAGHLQPDTLVFDHTLSQTDDLSKWEVPLEQTWLKRYLPARA